MNQQRTRLWGVSWLALAACAASAPAFAAEAPADTRGTVEELVVTAQKRAENIQDVPLSIIAVGEKAMEAKGIQDVVGLERAVPNLLLEAIAQL
jgi:iron complex outermembrane receptor protein